MIVMSFLTLHKQTNLISIKHYYYLYYNLLLDDNIVTASALSLNTVSGNFR